MQFPEALKKINYVCGVETFWTKHENEGETFVKDCSPDVRICKYSNTVEIVLYYKRKAMHLLKTPSVISLIPR